MKSLNELYRVQTYRPAVVSNNHVLNHARVTAVGRAQCTLCFTCDLTVFETVVLYAYARVYITRSERHARKGFAAAVKFT